MCKQVRDSLEKVRERMYGQFGGMQQSVNKLTQEIKVMSDATPPSFASALACEAVNKSENVVRYVCLQESNSHRRTLESEVKTRTTAMDTFDQMNSSLIVANLSLQVTQSLSGF